jgi:thioredoxin 1
MIKNEGSTMKQKKAVFFFCLLLTGLVVFALPQRQAGAALPEIPVKGMVTLVDLGARSCIPCKMMAPILEELEKTYRGKAAVIFIDVRENPAESKRFKASMIPTQIFFDQSGKEVYRHVGFLGKQEIIDRLEGMLRKK